MNAQLLTDRDPGEESEQEAAEREYWRYKYPAEPPEVSWEEAYADSVGVPFRGEL